LTSNYSFPEEAYARTVLSTLPYQKSLLVCRYLKRDLLWHLIRTTLILIEA
jgi:hypothetical protein